MSDQKTILVADDEIDLREALVTFLEAEGFNVLAATNGREALDLAWKHTPDLIMLDIQMPEMTGLEALRELRSSEGLENTHVMMLTAQSDMNNISEALQLGGTNFQYLTKTDWKLADVAARVKDQLGLS